MYQITWSKLQHVPSSGHNFVDTWHEVIDWIAEMDESKGVNYWTVSVVCDGSNSEHVEFYPEGTLEKAMLMDNLAKMMPDMDHSEVSAALMNFAAKYWDQRTWSRALICWRMFPRTLLKAGSRRKLRGR